MKTIAVRLTVNQREVLQEIDPRTTLLDLLRERLDLTGTKKGCNHGQCGACTVHVNGRRVLSCLTLAATLEGAEVTSIEGVGEIGDLHPLQTAFIQHDGFQCGFCTAGQIMSALLQRNRCLYFPDLETRCNKREPGAGCDAIEGANRMNAVLGGSAHCIATHASDLCVALRALDAVVHLHGRKGERQVPIGDFHKLPGDTPHIEDDLAQDEMIVAIEVPPCPVAANSTYVKLRDRTSYAFALVSVAAALRVEDGTVADVRMALGGVGTVPWRDEEAEAAMRGQPVARKTFDRAGEILFRTAAPRDDHAFEVALGKRAITRTLMELGGEAA